MTNAERQTSIDSCMWPIKNHQWAWHHICGLCEEAGRANLHSSTFRNFLPVRQECLSVQCSATTKKVFNHQVYVYHTNFWHEATPKKSISCKKTKNPWSVICVAPFRAPSLWDLAWRNILCYSCMPLFSSRTFHIHSSVSLLVCGYNVTHIGPHFKLSNEALGLPPLLQHWCSFLLPLPVNYRASVQVQWRWTCLLCRAKCLTNKVVFGFDENFKEAFLILTQYVVVIQKRIIPADGGREVVACCNP